MFDRFNRVNRQRKDKEHRSQLEDQVEKSLSAQGFSPSYEVDKFNYVLHRKYTPDFRVGDVYVEVKGWWPSAERTKFLAVVMNNPGLPIFVALQRPHMTLSKQSKTTYAKWCQKHGIAWCPVPIPKDFMQQWITGSRPSFRAQDPTAKAPTLRQGQLMDPSTASAARDGSTTTDPPGKTNDQ